MDVKKGEIIKVAVVREGLFKEFYVVKGEFDVPVVEDVKVLRYGELRVGYVKINNFTQPALGAFEKALEELQQEGFDVLLLDLRDNGGGLISVAKGIVDMLVGGEGVMFYLEGRGKNFGVYQFKNKEGLKEEEKQILEELAQLDIANLTPLQALLKLASLKERLMEIRKVGK